MGGGDDLQVTGGVGGAWARLDDLRRFADRSDDIGDTVRSVAARLSGMVLDGDLVASAVLSPSTAAQAEAALVDAGARVTGSALRLETSARGLRAVASAWEALDAAATIRQEVTEVGTFGVLATGGVASTVIAAPFVYAANLGERTGDALHAGFDDGWGALWDGLGDAWGDAGRDSLGDLGSAWSETLLAMPELTDAVVEGLGTTASLGAGHPLAYEDTVVGLLAAAGLAGWFDDSATISVTRASLDGIPAADLVVPRGVGDLFLTQDLLMAQTRDDPGASRLRVINVGTADQPAWVVQVPGTQEWGTTAGPDPSDLTTNLHLTGPEDAALLDAVDEAMAMAGVGADDPVMLVGHSQGGIAAAAFAAQADARGRNVTHVVTGGSPIAHIDVPDDVQVLAMEHTTDPVPRLDGDPNPDRPHWTTVTRDVGGSESFDDPIAPHAAFRYEGTGRLVDQHGDPSVQAFLTSADPFFDGDIAPADAITDVTISRDRSD